MSNPGITDLISYWPMDEVLGTRVDVHGSNHLASNNGVGSTTGVQGLAADFELDNNEYLSKADNAELSIAPGQSFTFAGWVNFESVIGASPYNLLSKALGGGGSSEYYIHLWNDRLLLKVRNSDDSGEASVQTTILLIDTTYFVRAWYDSVADTINIQIDDGTPFEATGLPELGLDGNHDFRFGIGPWGEYLDGWLDEWCFYKRVLTTAESGWLYNSGSGRTYSEINPPPVDLTAVGITTTPVLNTPTVGQIHVLSAVDIIANPILGIPTITHIHVLSAVDITIDPALDIPSIGQTHVLSAVDITANPVLGTPTLFSEYKVHLYADGITLAPVVGKPEITHIPVRFGIGIGLPPIMDRPVYVFNSSLDIVGIIDDYYSLIWAERYFEVGDFELELPIEYALDSSVAFGNFLYIGNSDKLMIIEDIKPSFAEDKTSLLVRGESVESIFKRRILLDLKNVDNVAEDIIYDLVAENVTNPADADRKISLFSTSFPSTSTTVEFEEQLEIQTLYDAIKTICKSTGLGFKIVNASNLLSFSVYEGEDRSYDQGTNPYVIFSDDFDNVISSSFYESEKDKVNIVLVVTDDSVPALQKVFVWEEGGSEPTELNRRETVLETTIDRDIDSPPLGDAKVLAIIGTRGRVIIEEKKTVGLFEGDFDIQGNFEYGVDFFMGDIVQCNLERRNVKARIIELVRSYSTEGEKSYVVMDFII